MGLFDRVESKLERAVQGVFARTMRAEVHPVEIASAIRRAMDDRAVSSTGRSVVPNVFTIEVSETDFERLSGDLDNLEMDLVAAAEEHCDTQRYTPAGPIDIELAEDGELETGVFRVRPSKAAHPREAAPATPSAVREAPYAGGPPEAPADAAYQVGHPENQADRPGLAGGAHPAYGMDEDDHGVPDWAAAATPPPPPAVPAVPVLAAAPAAPAIDHPAPRTPDGHVTPPTSARRVNPADRPWLDVDGERYPLMGAMTILGRDDSADIILDDPGISRRHSELRVTTDGRHFVTTIRDLGSTNGTFVNGERVTSEHLEDGDVVTVGRTSVTYRAGRR